MKFYHGTSEEKWHHIQDEGVLWGIRNAPSRCTYLASTPEEAACYGNVVLEIEHNPKDGINNYCEECWQFREYTPIPLEKIMVYTKR